MKFPLPHPARHCVPGEPRPVGGELHLKLFETRFVQFLWALWEAASIFRRSIRLLDSYYSEVAQKGS
jgi:hypothetical protein